MYSRQFRVAHPSARGFIVALSSLFGIGIALAAPGDLDSGFGGDGLWSLASDGGQNSLGDDALAGIQQSDGKLVLAGRTRVGNSSDFIVVRLAADGTLDAGFGAEGLATVDFGVTIDVANAVIQQSDGKLVLAGAAITPSHDEDATSDMALARFNADGSLDSTFGNAGLVTLDLGFSDSAFDVIQQADGKLVIAGETITKINTSTRPLPGPAHAILARFNADGSLDTTFGLGGTALVDFGGGLESTAVSLAPQDDGKLVAVGLVQQDADSVANMALMRLTADGILDLLFDGDGMVVVDFDGSTAAANSVAIQPDGAIVAAGSSYSAASDHLDATLVRVNGDGSLDSTFGDGGRSFIDLGSGSALNSIVVRADNSLAATGNRVNSEFGIDMFLAHFTSTGTIDLTYAVEGVATADFGEGTVAPESFSHALIQQADGKLIAVGSSAVGLAAARFDDGATSPGVIGLISTFTSIDEVAATVAYTVRRTGGSNGSVSVDYATVAGTATSGSDFQEASGTLSWDDGDTSSQVITINLIDDAEVEAEQSFSLTLSAPTGGAVLAANEAVTETVSDDIDSGDGDGDGDGAGGGGGGAFGEWSLVFLYGFVFAGSVRRRRKYLVQT